MTPARFVARENRFLVLARLDDGTEVDLPNTGRLTHLLEPGRRLLLRREDATHRKTGFTVIRAWDGCWVALEASLAPALLADWLAAGHPLGAFGPVTDLRTEVRHGRHRLDLVAETPRGPVWVEVKSGGRARGRSALLSGTPSGRGVDHLRLLSAIVGEGGDAAAAFVVQRPDVEELLVGGDADPEWIDTVRTARDAGAEILAYGCAVDEETVRIDRELPVVWDDR